MQEPGYSRDKIAAYHKEFKNSEDCILFDGTDISSCLENMDLPKFGKNKFATYLINVMHVFSVKQ